MARTHVISYGTFDSNDTGWSLTGVDDYQQDERSFKCSYEVVLHRSTEALLAAAEAVMVGQINQRNLAFKVVANSETLWHFNGDMTSAAAGQENAEFIFATFEALDEHRTALSRAYRISVVVTRGAKQTGKLGVYDQTISVSTAVTGQRRLNFAAQFTPDPTNASTDTALDRYGDGTTGFIALTTAIISTLTGTWERSGSITQRYDEDSRTLSARTSFVELLFDQDANGRDSAALFGARYDIQLDRQPGFGIPGKLQPKPLAAVTVSWSSAVDVAGARDLKEVIETDIIPYVTSTVCKKLIPDGSAAPKLLKHTLKADYVTNRIAGNLFYLVQESTLLEMSKRTNTNYRRGITLVPILDGSEFARDMHTGPGRLVMTVVIGVRVIGRTAEGVLKTVEVDEVKKANKAGYIFLGRGTGFSPSTEHFTYPIGGGGTSTIETTVQTTVLRFEKASIRPARNLSAPGATQTKKTGFTVNSQIGVDNNAALGFAQKNATVGVK